MGWSSYTPRWGADHAAYLHAGTPCLALPCLQCLVTTIVFGPVRGADVAQAVLYFAADTPFSTIDAVLQAMVADASFIATPPMRATYGITNVTASTVNPAAADLPQPARTPAPAAGGGGKQGACPWRAAWPPPLLRFAWLGLCGPRSTPWTCLLVFCPRD